MAGLLQVRGVPEPTRRVLKSRAAARGQSLNAYLLQLLEQETARPTAQEVLFRAAARAERSPVSSVEAVRLAREDRDHVTAPRP